MITAVSWHSSYALGMPPCAHPLEQKRKNHKKTCTEDYTGKGFSHMLKAHISLHCHAAQLILSYAPTGFLWIFKGIEMLQSRGKKSTACFHRKKLHLHIIRTSTWLKDFIIFYVLYTTHKIQSIKLRVSILHTLLIKILCAFWSG